MHSLPAGQVETHHAREGHNTDGEQPVSRQPARSEDGGDRPLGEQRKLGDAEKYAIRGTRWAAGRPYASLLVCLGLIAVQVVTWAPLFVLVQFHTTK